MRINKSKWLLQQKLCFLSSSYSVDASWLRSWEGAVNIIRISKAMATREFAEKRAENSWDELEAIWAQEPIVTPSSALSNH